MSSYEDLHSELIKFCEEAKLLNEETLEALKSISPFIIMPAINEHLKEFKGKEEEAIQYLFKLMNSYGIILTRTKLKKKELQTILQFIVNTIG